MKHNPRILVFCTALVIVSTLLLTMGGPIPGQSVAQAQNPCANCGCTPSCSGGCCISASCSYSCSGGGGGGSNPPQPT